ncbi:MAG: extracellular solute-binding protein [Lachnospiraceae bacterium]|nr:extracellular solute-binding protein [Lachnospiraceae bacterium]
MAGCGKASDNGEIKIKWMFWDDLTVTEDKTSLGYAEVIKRFNEQYDGKYEVEAITTNLEEYDTKLNALITAKNCPDVYICNPGPNLTQYVENGAAADLTEILAGDPDWYGSFTDGIFERLTYDGKIYAVPANFTAALVFYNTEIFTEVGVTPPTTFDEWIAVCEQIKAAGYNPIACSAGTPWCLSMVAGYLCDRAGGPDNLASISDGTGSWLDPSFITAGEKLDQLKDYFQETAAGDSNDQATAMFYNGQAAMLVQGSWVIGQINGSAPDFEDNCGVFSFPAIDGGADPNRMIVKTDNMVMSATTKYQDACIALIKAFTDETAQKYTAEVGGKIPVVNVTYDEAQAPAQLGYVMDILARSTGTFGFYNESLDSVEAGDVFDNAMVDLFLDSVTPQEAFQKVQDFYVNNVWNQ